MKLDNECIRDILMMLEDESMPSKYIRFSQLHAEFDQKYNHDVVRGHIFLLEDAGFIKITSKFLDGDGLIDSITWSGQQYIKDIKNEDVWNILKEHGKNCSLDVIVSLAKDVASGIVKKKLKDIGVIGD